MGTFWASLTMALITNFINMQSVTSPWVEKIIIGAMLLAIVVFQSATMREWYAKIGDYVKEKRALVK